MQRSGISRRTGTYPKEKKIYDFFELNEGIEERVEFLYQIYEGGDTIITGEGLEFEYETDIQESVILA